MTGAATRTPESRTFVGDVESLLRRPRAFFRERRERHGGWRRPVAIVLALGLFPLAAQLTLTAATPSPDAGGRQLAYAVGSGGGGTVGVALGTLVGALVSEASAAAFWLAFAAVFYLVTLPFDPAGGVGRLLRAAAWGFVPTFLYETAWLAALVVEVGRRPPPATDAAADAFVAAVQSTPLMAAVDVLGVACTLWTGGLWLLAVAEVRDVGRAVAGAAVALPVGVRLLLVGAQYL
jgi:hypothetical protein